MSERFLYLHGFASSPASHKAAYFRERFAELGIELPVPDLAEGDFEHLTLTRQLAVVGRAAGTGPVSLIGSSMGGYLAALYAARHPETHRLVLLAPAFGFLRRWPESLGPEQMAAWRQTGHLAVYHYGEGRERALAHGLIEDAARYEDFPAFSQPALILHGADDATVPVEISRAFAARHANVRLDVLPSDHQLLDVLPDVWEKTRGFLFESASG